MKSILSYNNDPALKQMFIARFDAHVAADDVIQGTGFYNGKGCFIGCTMNEYEHDSFASQIGPLWLAELADSLFEACPDDKSGAKFGQNLLRAIPIGVDLEPVRNKFLLRILTRLLDLDLSSYEKTDEVKQTINQVLEAIKSGEKEKLMDAARTAARAADNAWDAAWDAARVAAGVAETQLQIDDLLELVGECK